MSFPEYLASKIAEHILRRKLGPKIKPLRWYDLFVFLGAILFIIGLALFIVPLTTTADITPFLESGIEDTATITKLEIRERPLGFRGLTSSNEYIVHLIYIPGKAELNKEAFDFNTLLEGEGKSAYIADENAETITTQTQVLLSVFEKLSEDQSGDILYLPDEPERVMLVEDVGLKQQISTTPENNRGLPFGFIIGGIVLIVLWIVIKKRQN